MIRRDPSLRLVRLLVTKSGKSAYDQTFHAGVNVIRSDGNSRGKSTIADLIFFSLGGNLTDWKPEAAGCDHALAEVLLNGSTLTLRREIPASAQAPMWIFFGSMADGMADLVQGWVRLPYARHADRDGFSQALFRALDIPDVPSEDANITMHQLLRLMYVDQLTPVNAIFRMDDRDSPLRRQAVGDLLSGVLDDRIYPSQIRARLVEKQYAEITGQFAGLMRVLRKVDDNLDFGDLLSKVNDVENSRRQALKEIEELRSSRFSPNTENADASPVLETLRRDVDKVGRDIVEMQRGADRLTLAIEDADLLIADIEKSLIQIKQSQSAGETLGPFVFSFCPSCFSPIAGDRDHAHCHLCKSELDDQQDMARYARLRNELQMQLRESRELQSARKKARDEMTSKLGGLQKVRQLLSEELLDRSRHYLTEADSKIEALTRSVGYFDRELIDLERERRLATEVVALAAAKSELNDELSKLRRSISMWIEEKEQRQSSIYRLISNITADLLSKDVPSDIEKISGEEIRFDFGRNEIIINDKRGYSASSQTVIKNAFHLALLFASCVDARMKYPRFLLIDNIEDKGMTPDRSHNFQHMIVEMSEKANVEHQIIFTTSMPAPDLEHEKFAVGPKYTEKHMSLNIG